ncbi:DUF2691 family protein [Bacillus toyonensis]|uniref:DUF2691 family protein n=1 Tax=Bacillus toyonensis TaxID=155322 RepID=A0ABX6G2A1_9BACI|nr:DUF2691 family protein [Bacillus toyonensis]MED2737885.1 DUF2691 family protein [Bacillus toyonensis]QHA15991.1 DUF2691 family protein [Bacillus toyonensis]
MNRGISFEIPTKKYSGKSLADILHPIPCDIYKWHIGYEEIHIDGNAGSCEPFFGDNETIDGNELKRLVNGETYLAIFAELKAFPKNAIVSEIATYNDFVSSECEIIVLMYDCYYIEIYCKDTKLIENICDYVKQQGYTDIEYKDENDPRTGMYVW